MESAIFKRSKNFTEREKSLLIDVAKQFVHIIDNKKTDGTTVDAKKQAWEALTNTFNAASETGHRTEKQLHALYDNLKKKARKNMSDDKSELYKTGGGTFCPKTNTIDEKVVALLTPQFKPLQNPFDSSAPYYIVDKAENAQVATLPVELEIIEQKENNIPKNKAPEAPSQVVQIQKIETPKTKKSLTETKKRNINNLSSFIINRKKDKQIKEDVLTEKKLEILEIQKQQENIKLENTRVTMELDIELKRVLLENAKMDLELKRTRFNL